VVRVPMGNNDTLKRIPIPPREFGFKIARRFTSATRAPPAINYRYKIAECERTLCIADHTASSITYGKNPQTAHIVHHHRSDADIAVQAEFSLIEKMRVPRLMRSMTIGDCLFWKC